MQLRRQLQMPGAVSGSRRPVSEHVRSLCLSRAFAARLVTCASRPLPCALVIRRLAATTRAAEDLSNQVTEARKDLKAKMDLRKKGEGLLDDSRAALKHAELQVYPASHPKDWKRLERSTILSCIIS